jgi:hypothetical protein
VTMAQPCWGNLMIDAGIPWFHAAGGAPTHVENVFELLDEPGEWYLDRAARLLYYMPLNGQNMTSATVVAPTLEAILTASGTLDAPVHDIEFAGLTFAYATWLRPATTTGFAEMQANFTQTGSAGDGRQGGCTSITPNGSCPFGSWSKTPANVTFHAARNITLTHDTFTHLGGAAVGFEFGASASTVADCTFTDVSGSGIQLGGTDDPNPSDSRATVSGIVVQSNYLHDLPTEYLGGVGIFVGYTTNVSIRNNLIAGTPYSGISIGWGGWARTSADPNPPSLLNASRANVVANNHIFSALQLLSDGSSLYSNGNRGTQFTNGDTYSGNHFHDQLHFGYGVYDDIGSRFITISGQVLYRVPNAWGGCAASGDLLFQNGFWSPVPPPGAGFGCNPPPTTNVTFSNNVDLGLSDPAVACEANSPCSNTIALAGPQGADPLLDIVDGRGETVLVDDQDPGFTYTGSWTNDAARPFNDIGATLHYTTVNGDSFQFAFSGTGIDYLAEFDSNRGGVAITVDGVPYPNAGCSAQQLVTSQVCARVRGLPAGPHLLRGVKLDGTFMSVDAVRVYPDGSHGRPVDDTASTIISYSGSSWTLVIRSTFAEYQNTLHSATLNGDSYTVSFSGTGAAIFGDRDAARGIADVSVDGAFVQRIDASTSAAVSSQQRLFGVAGLASGPHTITVVKRGGTFMDVDRVDVYATTTVNDDDPSVSYAGSGWVDSEGRAFGDYNADVHYTTQDGDSATFTFTGSGVDFVTETNSDRGVIDVRIDGVPRGRLFTYSPSFGAQQTVYRVHGLNRDTHQLVLTKRGASFMAVDAFVVLE